VWDKLSYGLYDYELPIKECFQLQVSPQTEGSSLQLLLQSVDGQLLRISPYPLQNYRILIKLLFREQSILILNTFNRKTGLAPYPLADQQLYKNRTRAVRNANPSNLLSANLFNSSNCNQQ